MTYRLLLLVAYVAFLILMATLPPPDLPTLPVWSTFKWHHAGAFLVCTLLIGWVLRPHFQRIGWPLYTLAAVFAFLLGALIEFVQRYLPYRSGQSIDLIPNSIGIACGLVLFALWGRWERWRKRRAQGVDEAVERPDAGRHEERHG